MIYRKQQKTLVWMILEALNHPLPENDLAGHRYGVWIKGITTEDEEVPERHCQPAGCSPASIVHWTIISRWTCFNPFSLVLARPCRASYSSSRRLYHPPRSCSDLTVNQNYKIIIFDYPDYYFWRCERFYISRFRNLEVDFTEITRSWLNAGGFLMRSHLNVLYMNHKNSRMFKHSDLPVRVVILEAESENYFL